MDINERIARRVRELRDARGLSLEALAERSGVSRSNISLIERGGSSPSATVLDRLATGLDVSLASLFEGPGDGEDAPSPLRRAADQAQWTDPASGYRRRNLSPDVPSPLQLVEVDFPAGQRVAYDNGPRDTPLQQQVWMLAGRMQVQLGAQTWQLDAGDCLALTLDAPVLYFNPGPADARYLVALSRPGSGRRGA